MEIIQYEQDNKYMDPPLASNIKNLLLTFRRNISLLYDYHDGPIPYVYINFALSISLVYLPLFSYAVAVNVREGSGFLFTDGYGAMMFFFLMDFFMVLARTFRAHSRYLGEKE